MELFHLHIDSGRDLCKRLDRIQPMQRATLKEKSKHGRVEKQSIIDKNEDDAEEEENLIGDETFAVWSTILANAETIQGSFSDNIRRSESIPEVVPSSPYYMMNELNDFSDDDDEENDTPDKL